MEEEDTGRNTAKPEITTQPKEIIKDKYEIFNHRLSNKRQTNKAESISVKGKLKAAIGKWKEIGANKFILNIIEQGYKLPFISTPKAKYFKNNQSAIANSGFVSSTIDDLLNCGSAIEVEHKPLVVSPLSVAFSSSGKKRLILDLRYVNEHLHKEFVSFDDWREFQNFVKPNGFAYKFDLRKGYHHIDIFQHHQNFLGFSWNKNNRIRYYVFTVLPFGLSTAPNVFTKLMRVLVRRWHSQGIKISVFLDDGCGIGDTFEETIKSSTETKSLLSECGLVINKEKTIWYPTKNLTWLGINIDLNSNIYQISEKRIFSLLESCEQLLSSPYTTARKISQIAGKVISTKFVLSNIVRLKTRFLYKTIDFQNSWDSRFNILEWPEAHKEILFWRDNINRLNKRDIETKAEQKTLFFSDASNYAIGAVGLNNKIICHKNFDAWEKRKSSTWRELEGIRFAMVSSKEFIKNSNVVWNTDNKAASLIVESGSRKIELHNIAIDIYEIAKFNNINLNVQWIPRENNKEADRVSKIIDIDDWKISDEFFGYLDNLWGPFSIDRFANHYNSKVERFNSRYYEIDTEAVDAFTQDWRGENNWFVPPVKCISRLLNRIEKTEKVKGTLIIPHWTSKPFWAIVQKEGKFKEFIKDSIFISDASKVLEPGRFTGSFLGNEYEGGLWALKIES